jgi:hypothetical protein
VKSDLNPIEGRESMMRLARMSALLLALLWCPPIAADLYLVDGTLSLDFGGGAGSDITGSGVVNVTSGGVSGEKFVSMTVPANLMVGTGNAPIPTTPGVTLGGLAISSLQYTLSNLTA